MSCSALYQHVSFSVFVSVFVSGLASRLPLPEHINGDDGDGGRNSNGAALSPPLTSAPTPASAPTSP